MTYSKFGKRKLQQRLLYPTSLSFRFESETKNFTDKPKLVKDEKWLSRNDRGTSLSRKDRNWKNENDKRKNLVGKGKHKVKIYMYNGQLVTTCH